ncbi:MAG: hypothetical protein F6K00_25505 [Leptolyngbya sp. SIOISBB]|nr:hypothetical protein [Leptolyngbya sp. SIOISBB]
MEPKILTDNQKNILSVLRSSGVVIEYLLATRTATDDDDYLAHRSTALLTLSKMKKDIDDYFCRLLQDEDYQDRSRDDFFEVSIEPEKMSGQQISINDFLGSYYSLTRRKAAIRGRTRNFLNSYFWAGQEEIKDNIVDVHSEFESLKRGYAYAFFEPPYFLKGTALEKEHLFHEVERLFLQRFDTSAIIWQWSDGCSNFFDAGREWWGTYFYTYSLPGDNAIVGIVASATD